MEEETKNLMRKEDAEKAIGEVLAAKKIVEDYYDDTDYAAQDRAQCMSEGHLFAYVGALGPSCECGDRYGPYADFSPDDIARGELDLAIYKHDKNLSSDGESQ